MLVEEKLGLAPGLRRISVLRFVGVRFVGMRIIVDLGWFSIATFVQKFEQDRAEPKRQ